MRRAPIRAGLNAGVLLLLTGCTGGLHRAGEHQITVLGSHDHPIKGDVLLWPYGEGRAESAGVAVAYNYFATDRLSIGAAITPYRVYNQRNGDVYSGELQIAARYYVADFKVASTPVGIFGEVLCGMMQSAKSVPETGTHTNFTQDTGLGVEIKLTDSVSWISGYRLRHLSNCYAFGPENPSQNDHQVYTGIGISW